MKDIQALLDKIRSDAAECLLLGSLAVDGKREVFVKTAEHLKALASEVEKAIATNGVDIARAENREQTIASEIAPAHHQQALRPRRTLPWFLAIVILGGIVGGIFGTNHLAKGNWSLPTSLSKSALLSNFTLLTKYATSASTQETKLDETKQAIATVVSGELAADRKMLIEQLGALGARIENLQKALDNQKAVRAEMAAPSNKEAIDVVQWPLVPNPKPFIPEEKPVVLESRASAPESIAIAKPSGVVPPTTESLHLDPVDRVGSIPAAPRPAEHITRKPTIGPSGCMQFRSYDPESGEYTTFEGQRRQCR
jgi:hypothetical protein